MKHVPSADGPPSGYDLMRERMRSLPVQNIADIARLGLERSDIIPLWFGEGDLPTPGFICDAASRAMADGHTFYTHQNGIPELCESLARYQSRLYRREIAADRVTVTPGGMAAILLSVQMIMDAGDNVVTVDPVWPNIRGAVQLMGGERRSVRMHLEEDGWHLDLDALAAQCDGRTKAVFLASPGNPTGWIMPAGQQQQLLDFCRARGIWIIADEVYARFHYEQPVAPSFLEIAEPEDPVLVVNSFSKAWSMTGWRIGWLTHPPSCRRTLANLVQYNTSGTATFLQHAAVTAIEEGEGYVRELVERSRRARDIVCDALGNLPRARLSTRPKGGLYVYLKVAGVADSRAFCEQVFRRTGVGLAPGFAFDDDDKVRICFGASPEVIAEAMERIRPEFM
jgi:aspartate aminotransferase